MSGGSGFPAKDVSGATLSLTDLPYHIVSHDLLALGLHAVETPHEIWYEWTNQPIVGFVTQFTLNRAALVRRYLSLFLIDGQRWPITVIMTVDSVGFAIRDVIAGEQAFDLARTGHLLYRKGAKGEPDWFKWEGYRESP